MAVVSDKGSYQADYGRTKMSDEVYRCEVCGQIPPDKDFYNPYLCGMCGKKVCKQCERWHNVEVHKYNLNGSTGLPKPMSLIEKIQAEAHKKVSVKVDDEDIPF